MNNSVENPTIVDILIILANKNKGILKYLEGSEPDIKVAAEMIKSMYDKNIRLEIRYSGAGDSGEMFELENLWYGGNGLYNWKTVDTPLEERLKPLTKEQITEFETLDYWNLSDFINYDWYNNDGGGGSIYFDLHRLSIEVDGYYREYQDIDAQQEEIEL